MLHYDKSFPIKDLYFIDIICNINFKFDFMKTFWCKVKGLIFFALVVSVVACNKEDLSDCVHSDVSKINEQSSLVRFNSLKDMLDTYLYLSELDEDEKQVWLDSVNITEPLLNHLDSCTDKSIMDVPVALQLLFNKDLRIQIGDTIARYENGVIVSESIAGEKTIDELVLAKITSTPIEIESEENNNLSRSTTVSGPWAIGDKTIWIGSRYIPLPVPIYSDCQHRYVHEFRTIVIYTNQGVVQQLFFDIKFHYKKHKGWREATGENRHVNVNLSIKVFGISGNEMLWNQSYSTKANIEKPICYSFISQTQFNNRWEIFCSGTIVHSVDGYPKTKYTDKW